MTSYQLGDLSGANTISANLISEINTQTGTSYTILREDGNKTIYFTSGSAITCSLPADATVNLPNGFQLTIIQAGTGQITISVGGGATLNSADSLVKLRTQFSAGTAIKTASNTWFLSGDLTA